MTELPKLADIKARYEALDPSEWEPYTDTTEKGSFNSGVYGLSAGYQEYSGGPMLYPFEQEDAEFIGHSKVDVPALFMALEDVVKRCHYTLYRRKDGDRPEKMLALDTLSDIRKYLDIDSKTSEEKVNK